MEVWDNYVTVFTKAPIISWFFNSVFVTVVGTVAMLFTSSIAGFVFAKYEFRLKNALFLFVLATMMVPAQVTMIPSFLLIDRLGMYDSLTALIIPGLVGGFGIFLCRQFIEHRQPVRSGRHRRRQWLLHLRASFNAADQGGHRGADHLHFSGQMERLPWSAAVPEQPQNMTMPLALNFFTGQHNSDNGAIMAAAVIVTLPVTIVFLCLQKQFIKGIAIASVNRRDPCATSPQGS